MRNFSNIKEHCIVYKNNAKYIRQKENLYNGIGLDCIFPDIIKVEQLLILLNKMRITAKVQGLYLLGKDKKFEEDFSVIQ